VSLLQGSIGVYVVLETDPAYEFRSAVDASVLLAAYPSSDLEGLNFTHGLFGFTLTGVAVGGGASVRVILPDDNQPTTYYQRGATPDNQSAHWYPFLWDGQTGASFNGNVITLQFIDGHRGDDDLTADGVIIDPGGPASRAKNTGGGSGGGGGGCSLKYTAADPAQAGFWWLLLLLLSIQGFRLVAVNMKSTDRGTGRA
jgi:hypothetical protein